MEPKSREKPTILLLLGLINGFSFIEALKNTKILVRLFTQYFVISPKIYDKPTS